MFDLFYLHPCEFCGRFASIDCHCCVDNNQEDEENNTSGYFLLYIVVRRIGQPFKTITIAGNQNMVNY
jgi:hypothetical protein